MRSCERSSSIRISPTARSGFALTHSLVASTPSDSTIPGTATTSSPRTTSGQPSRSERGILASTNTSWIFFVRPASRSPGRHPRTIRPGSSDRISHPPSRPRRRGGQEFLEKPRVGRARAPEDHAEVERGASRLGVSETARPARGEGLPLVEGRSMFSLAAGVKPLEQRQDLVADQAAQRVGIRGIGAARRARARGRTPPSPRARREQRRTTRHGAP